MGMTPGKEHEYKASLEEDVFYPDHAPRTESATFRHTKAHGKAAGDVCAISGHTDGLEYHHVFCEAAFTNAVDWQLVKDIALGKVTTVPLLDLETDEPLLDAAGKPRTYPIERSAIGLIVGLTKMRGFDWEAFDPAHPETFVDSPANMLTLNAKFHRAKSHGIHELSLPLWIFQAFPRVPGFVFSRDELEARHKEVGQ